MELDDSIDSTLVGRAGLEPCNLGSLPPNMDPVGSLVQVQIDPKDPD